MQVYRSPNQPIHSCTNIQVAEMTRQMTRRGMTGEITCLGGTAQVELQWVFNHRGKRIGSRVSEKGILTTKKTAAL